MAVSRYPSFTVGKRFDGDQLSANGGRPDFRR
jgi:hypothetical protein